MRKKVYSLRFAVYSLFFVLFTVHFPLQSVCHAQERVSGRELIENAQSYDGKRILYEGEVIGEVMQRENGVWVNISDGQDSIGVWMPGELAGIITHKGNYKTQGDILEVAGIFNRACLVHGGDLDIHAISLRMIKPGWQKQEMIIPAKRSLVVILLVVLCLTLISKILIVR